MATKDSINKSSDNEIFYFKVKTKKELLRLFPKTYNHDAFCKCIFSILILVRCLLQRICSLPNLLDEIDLDRIEIVDTKFITSQLRANFFDMLYRAPFRDSDTRWVYFLIDFKSNNDQGAFYQLYRYINTLWEHLWIEAGKPDNFLFPCIISIIFHCGETEFTAVTNMAALLDLPENSILRICSLNYPLLAFDVNKKSEAELYKSLDTFKSLDEYIVNLFFYVLKITRSEEVNEKAIQLFEKLQDKLCEHNLLLSVWDMSLWYFYTSAKYFTRETYEKLVTLT
ncbi:MAG: Rpn family recombination-promoting nuclease/putative transposase, partial [Planctomycetaceae bacterium]|nr:Rpn family recombination-promoting nuclease/putative transposase [Planctomycetaceae bacterium]